jgi:hypothetical protein
MIATRPAKWEILHDVFVRRFCDGEAQNLVVTPEHDSLPISPTPDETEKLQNGNDLTTREPLLIP